MTKLDLQGFDTFFHELWDRTPFAWQHQLAYRVLNSEASWPDGIALPTSAGKTACMDIAVYALAAQADSLSSGVISTAPRRIFFVVDRRVIVDEAFERAKTLAEKLRLAQDGVLKSVADRLRMISGSNEPLACFQLRGGMYRSDAWSKNPIQPIIVASTVDQLGSRLLFRAYGRSFKAWPIQAGLVGNDSLIFLDEAHCSQPFWETLQAVKKYRAWAETPLHSPFHAVVMSATPPDGISDVFRDMSDEPRNSLHPLGKRQLSPKLAKLKTAKAKGKNASTELAGELVSQAEKLLTSWIEKPVQHGSQIDLFSEPSRGAPAVVIFCNRVDTAREVHYLLSRKIDYQAVLMTGRMRPVDKDDVISGIIDMLGADRSCNRVLNKPLFVVTTQSLEVGANLDFDLLITECASLDALRQRFGRLNRMGRSIDARAVIVIRADQSEKSEDDPVYGGSLSATWKWLNEHVNATQEINMGISAIADFLPTGEALAMLNASTGHAPVMLPAHVDVLCQTAPEPCPTPEIALFLHGSQSGLADVQICWRSDLTGDDEESWKDAVLLCPPASPECLSVPLHLIRRWLSGETTDSSADIEGVRDNNEHEAIDDICKRKVIRWRWRDDIEVIEHSSLIRPGDIVIIPSTFSGWQMLATLGDHPVADWGDRAYVQARDKAILRLHPDVLAQWSLNAIEYLKEIAFNGNALLNEDPEKLRDDVNAALNHVIAETNVPKHLAWIQASAQGLLHHCTILPHPTAGLILMGKRRLNQYAADVDPFSDEDDPAASGTASILLDEHLNGVGDMAADFARRCTLSEELSQIIEMAGRCHDYGKADPRFQAWLKGGNPWGFHHLLAKSEGMPQGRKESLAARKRSGYPADGRHELLSVRMLESKPDLLPTSEELHDLLLHLVESHHGYCRPFAPIIEDPIPVNVKWIFRDNTFSANTVTKLELLDSGVSERFWRLTRRYGWWGLAWMEAIMRLADHRRSEREECRKKNKTGGIHG